MSQEMNEMANYPNPSGCVPPVMYAPSSGPGYPPPVGYTSDEQGFPPAYSPPPNYAPLSETRGHERNEGPKDHLPVAADNPLVLCGLGPNNLPPQAPMTNPPAPGAGYPFPGTNYPHPGMQPFLPDFLRGLEYLTMVDQLLVHQQMELLEIFLGFETNNKYDIKNSLGQKIYFAKEDTDCCTRNCLGPGRPFDMKVEDNTGKEVLHFFRPCRCDSCCCPCCLQEMEVTVPGGALLGTIVQEWSICSPKFLIKNAGGDTELRIEGPLCVISCCSDIEFKVLSKDGETEVGCIRKQWSGLLRELFTDADHFGITFPIDLDVTMKALLLGACMLIDFMYFETAKNNN